MRNLKEKIHRTWWYARFWTARFLFGDILRWQKAEGWAEGWDDADGRRLEILQ